MTTTPRSLADLGTFWTEQGGVNLGVVGNQRHCQGYHLGKDRIYSECACKPDGTCESGKYASDYSVRNARDKAGLTNAASAIDLGRLGGSYDHLQEFSRWLVRQCQAKAAGYADVREIIYSPDGVKVQRYSGVDGAIHVGAGNGDPSHRFHTHISYYRDSALRDKRPLFAPFFALPDTAGDDMRSFTFTDTAQAGWLEVAGAGHSYLRLRTNTLHPASDDWPRKRAFGPVTLTDGGIGGPDDPRKDGYVIGSEAAFLLTSDVQFTPDADTRHSVSLVVDGREEWKKVI